MDSYRAHVPVLTFPIKLDVGAGWYPRDGFVRLDKDPCDGATDIIWDVAHDGIPLPDGCVGELYSSHFLEHIAPVDLHKVLAECFRVCAHTGSAFIRVPHGDTKEGRLPCHYSFWYEETMAAIGDWLKEPGKPDYSGDAWEVQRIWREEPYHLCAEYMILKGPR
jgi:predicted SAM-dependent methyltransferase